MKDTTYYALVTGGIALGTVAVVAASINIGQVSGRQEVCNQLHRSKYTTPGTTAIRPSMQRLVAACIVTTYDRASTEGKKPTIATQEAWDRCMDDSPASHFIVGTITPADLSKLCSSGE